MAVRDEGKGRTALRELGLGQAAARAEIRRLDLADLDSVRAFADGIHFDGLAVDVLVNNAGIMTPPRSLSPQGHESQFATNHLGHFALTGLLLDVLRRGRDARVVTMSSIVHARGRIHFDDLDGARHYSPFACYTQSKFANVLFGLELDRRLRAAGLPVRSILAHPGFSATKIMTSASTGLYRLFGRMARLFGQDAEAGVLSQLYAATEPTAQGGQFIGPDGFRELRGYPTIVRPVKAATDADLARRLWELSERLTGVSFDLVLGEKPT
jgi:NAD(P)-dependent dehydrogenase (short-subunit alcohol dehydrogenase family)